MGGIVAYELEQDGCGLAVEIREKCGQEAATLLTPRKHLQTHRTILKRFESLGERLQKSVQISFYGLIEHSHRNIAIVPISITGLTKGTSVITLNFIIEIKVDTQPIQAYGAALYDLMTIAENMVEKVASELGLKETLTLNIQGSDYVRYAVNFETRA